nr:hypothetical protein [Pseudonocardia sp.]
MDEEDLVVRGVVQGVAVQFEQADGVVGEALPVVVPDGDGPFRPQRREPCAAPPERRDERRHPRVVRVAARRGPEVGDERAVQPFALRSSLVWIRLPGPVKLRHAMLRSAGARAEKSPSRATPSRSGRSRPSSR